MADDLVLERDDDGVRELALNRPARYNAFDVPLIQALRQAFDRADEDDGVRAVLIRGEGKAFCAGGDVAAMRDAVERDGQAKDLFLELTGHLHPLVRAIRASPKPVVAAIHGPVAGGGFGLALACDWRVGTPDASFKPAYAKLGIVPDGGLTYFLPRLVGWGIANRIVLADQTVAAEDAHRWGLLDELAPAGDLHGTAMARALRLASLPADAFAQTKRLLDETLRRDLKGQLAAERERNAASAATDSLREGVAAFFEKREPRFRNR